MSPIQNTKPSEPPNTPQNKPQIPLQNRNTEEYEKIQKSPGIWGVFWCVFWGSDGALYFVWGTYDCNPQPPHRLSEKIASQRGSLQGSAGVTGFSEAFPSSYPMLVTFRNCWKQASRSPSEKSTRNQGPQQTQSSESL